jgi:hypothetical protein
LCGVVRTHTHTHARHAPPHANHLLLPHTNFTPNSMSQNEVELQLPVSGIGDVGVVEEVGVGTRVAPLVDLYFEMARRYQIPPVAAVTIALRLEPVTHLRLEPGSFALADLLPLAEVLKVRFEGEGVGNEGWRGQRGGGVCAGGRQDPHDRPERVPAGRQRGLRVA